MEINLAECHGVAVRAAIHVGEMIKSRIWILKSKVESKGSEVDLVTETDREAEEYIIATLKKSFPNHNYIAEESTPSGAKLDLTDNPTWIIDPVDGTMNFVHGYPNVAISIALLVNKVTEIGLIYIPVLDFFFEARRGEGATLNGEPIHISNETELSKTLLSFEFGSSRSPEKHENNCINVSNLIQKVHGIRSAGSAAINMAMVALGACDAYFEFGIHAWDVAAGDLLIREAGGVVMDPSGGKFDLFGRKVLCAATVTLANQLAKEICQFSIPAE